MSKRLQIGVAVMSILGVICMLLRLALEEKSSTSEWHRDLVLWQVLSSNGQSRLQVGYIVVTTNQLTAVLQSRTDYRAVVSVEEGVHFEDVLSTLQLLRRHGLSEVRLILDQEYVLPDEAHEWTNVPPRIWTQKARR